MVDVQGEWACAWLPLATVYGASRHQGHRGERLHMGHVRLARDLTTYRGPLLLLMVCVGAHALPAAIQGQGVAYQLQSVKGHVEIRKGGQGDWSAVTSATTAAAGDRVRTGVDGSAYVVTATGQRVALGPNTEVILSEPKQPGGWRVLVGRVLAVLSGGRTEEQLAAQMLVTAREAHGRSDVLWSVSVEGSADSGYMCRIANTTDSPIAIGTVEYDVIEEEYALDDLAERPPGTGAEGGRVDRTPAPATTLVAVAEEGLVGIHVRQTSDMIDDLAGDIEGAGAESPLPLSAAKSLLSKLWELDDDLWLGSEAFYGGDPTTADASHVRAQNVAQAVVKEMAAECDRGSDQSAGRERGSLGTGWLAKAEQIMAATQKLPGPLPGVPNELPARGKHRSPLPGVRPGDVLVVRGQLRQGTGILCPAVQIPIQEDMNRPALTSPDTGAGPPRSITLQAKDQPVPKVHGVSRWFVSVRRDGQPLRESDVQSFATDPDQEAAEHTVTFEQPGKYEVAACVADRSGNLSDVWILTVSCSTQRVRVEGQLRLEIRAPGAVAAAEG